MKKLRLTAALLFAGMLSVAGESYYYEGQSGLSASFPLIGGQYTLYLNAKRPVIGPWVPASKSCVFGGNLQRVWPDHDTMSLGSGVTISTIVPHKIGPVRLSVPAGLYVLYIARLADCDWHFSLESTRENAAGVAPVRILRKNRAGREFTDTVSMRDQVQFYTQYRTEHDAEAAVSGVLQIIKDGKIVQMFPLQVGHDSVSRATALFVDLQFDPGNTTYVGKNTAKCVVQIGSVEFTSSADFTLTP